MANSRKHKVRIYEQRNALQQIEHVAHCSCGDKEKSLNKATVETWRDIHTNPELRRRLRSEVREF